VRILIGIPVSILGAAIALITVAWAAYRIADHTNGSILSGGETRRYLLYVPESYNPNLATPLVISIHGFAQWPAHQSQLTGWTELANEHGFIVIHPSGTGFPKRWRTSGFGENISSDVIFLSDLITKLETEYNIDPNRIFVNGLSNGGGMTIRMACELPGRIAAIGSVAGAYTFPWSECLSARPVPAIIFHGTNDPIVPFQGGPSRDFDIPFPAIPEWVDTLARRNGCSDDVEDIPISDAVNGIEYMGCDADVIFFTITGGGHTWPGGERLPEFLTGTTTDDLNATQVMWEFFINHPLQP